MQFYVNGDSHCLGAMKDGPGDPSFAKLVAKHFNLDLVNQSEGASSTTRIIRTTQEYLSNNKPRLVLIGWGTWEREEWVYNNEYYNVMVGWYKHLPDPLRARYDTWVEQQNYDTLVKKSCIVHEQIHRLHKLLEACTIPHLFFNCMYGFQGVSKDMQYDWKTSYIEPYDGDKSYVWYLKNKQYEHDKWFHFPQEAHAEWAHVLIKHIEDHDIIY